MEKVVYCRLGQLMVFTIFVLMTASQGTNIVTITENQKDIHLFTQDIQLPDQTCNITKIRPITDYSIVVSWTSPVQDENGVYTVNVTLDKALDFEQKEIYSIYLEVSFTCDVGGEQKKDLPRWSIRLTDVKDSIPQFVLDRYEAVVPENQDVDTIIIYNITAIDEDGNDRIEYLVQTSENDREKFIGVSMIKDIEGLSQHVLDIRLSQPLNYELTTRYSFTVMVRDSVNFSSTCEVIIRVKDVQDRPPTFTLPVYSGRVDEMAPRGTSIATVSAIDGDGPAIRNQIAYSIVQGPVSVFTVNNVSGVITTKGQLDIDGSDPIGTNGLVILTIEAEELNTSKQVQYGNTTARTLVQIQIDDANDHPPLFGSPTYSGSIRGDAVAGEIVSLDGGGYISVTDQDITPKNNHFKLHIERDGSPWSVFETNIQSQFVQASVLIVLRQPEALEKLHNTHIRFQVVASDFSSNKTLKTENATSSSSPASSVADVIVFVLPRTTSAPPPEPIVHLPISESDVIVFVMGFLLLLNIILTVVICCLLRRKGDAGGLGLFRRNSKYYVSGRKTNENGGVERINNNNNGQSNRRSGFDNNNTVTNNTEIQNLTTATVIPPPLTTMNPKEGKSLTLTDAAVNRNMGVRNTVSSAANRNRCDVTHLKDAEAGTAVFPAANGDRRLKEETGPGQEVPPRSCDVAPLKHENEAMPKQNYNKSRNGSNDNKCDVIPLETSISSTSRALSSLLDRVHQKLAPGSKGGKSDACDLRPLHEDNSSLESSFTNSNNSSFSEKKTKCDGAALTDKISRFPSKPVSLSQVNTAFISEETEVKFPETQPKRGGPSLPPPPPPSNTASVIKSGGQPQKPQQQQQPVSQPQFIPSLLSPSKAQITQTGVPPVALALPIGTSHSAPSTHRNEDTKTVNNPVYREEENKRKAVHSDKKPAPQPISTPPANTQPKVDFVEAAKLLLNSSTQSLNKLEAK